jgi:hypothetical protein
MGMQSPFKPITKKYIQIMGKWKIPKSGFHENMKKIRIYYKQRQVSGNIVDTFRRSLYQSREPAGKHTVKMALHN